MKIFLDKVREANEGGWVTLISVDKCKEYIIKGNVTHLSVHPVIGYELFGWLRNIDKTLIPDNINIHTTNKISTTRMLDYLRTYVPSQVILTNEYFGEKASYKKYNSKTRKQRKYHQRRSCQEKKRYVDKAKAEHDAYGLKRANCTGRYMAYRCNYCKGYHVGRRNSDFIERYKNNC